VLKFRISQDKATFKATNAAAAAAAATAAAATDGQGGNGGLKDLVRRPGDSGVVGIDDDDDGDDDDDDFGDNDVNGGQGGGGKGRGAWLALKWGERSVAAALALCEMLRRNRRPAEAIPFARYVLGGGGVVGLDIECLDRN
jgi:hypothetical protein